LEVLKIISKKSLMENTEETKVRCPCGKKIKQSSMVTHLKSKKHITYLQNPKRLVISHEKSKVTFD